MERKPEVIVYKLGTNSIVKDSKLDRPFINDLARQAAFVWRELHHLPVIVCSGSIFSGRIIAPSLTQVIEDKQAAAIFGQPELTHAWRLAFRSQGMNLGEALLKDEDLPNLKRPLLTASRLGIVLLNGSDATYDSLTEKRIICADNDGLARCVAFETGANKLGFLTEVEGMLDKEGKVIESIANLEDLEKIDFFGKSANGTGGPVSKINEARLHITGPEKVAYIAGARIPDVIVRIAMGGRVGTKVTLPLQGILI